MLKAGVLICSFIVKPGGGSDLLNLSTFNGAGKQSTSRGLKPTAIFLWGDSP